jgi:hypothetical protein
LDSEIAEPASALISVAIGTLMEDHADAAVSLLPTEPDDRIKHFERLQSVGRDIAILAGAAEVLLRRKGL